MNHKYTLYCIPGHLFRSDRHYLLMDEWLLPEDTSILILSHGIMSEQEYRQYMSQERIMVFQNLSFSWVGLYTYHKSKRNIEEQYAGDLIRNSEVEWSGILNVR